MMKSIPIIILTIMILFGCKESKNKCKCDVRYLKENDSIINQAIADSSIFILDKSFKQTLLNKKGVESYRLYLKHPLKRYFQVYTVSNENNGPKLYVQQYVGINGNIVDSRLDTSFSINLSYNKWLKIKTSIETNCFWSIRYKDGLIHKTRDGEEIFIEGYQPNKRNCANSDFFVLSNYLSEDSRINKISNEIRKLVNEKDLHVL